MKTGNIFIDTTTRANSNVESTYFVVCEFSTQIIDMKAGSFIKARKMWKLP